ncbi:MAG TPA: efflux transporter outer membrane subunit [Burkholderiales bacterium]|nr:efflux transporter outer membrane subunit [Burkholderiales bacterium]
MFLGGCTVGPDFVRPTPPEDKRYTHQPVAASTVPADSQAQNFEQGAKIAAEWWRLFNSSQINALIEEAIADNPSLQAAQASLRQNQDTLRAGYGIFYPQVDAGAGVSREKFSGAGFGQTALSNIFTLFTLSATVSYTLDVFGGERRALEGLSAQVDYQRYAALGTYLALSGNIVNTAIAHAAYAAQIQATDELIALEAEQVHIMEAQVTAGTIPYVNLLSVQTQLASTQATLPPLRQRRDQAEHLLATLTGRTPAESAPPQIDLADLTLPSDLPVSLPSELVRQRPDILAAEAQLHSASASIGVATAAMFPRFTLNGSVGQASNSANTLLQSSSTIWSIGADITAPLFHGGTLWYQRKAAMEAYQAALASYRQSVLGGLEQVADTLRALEHDAEGVDAQSRAWQAAGEAYKLLRANYQAGLANYLQVLIADAQYHQATILYLQARAQRLQDTTALFVALGGGWWNQAPEMLGSK